MKDWTEEEWLTVKDITEILNVTRATVSAWVNDGDIPSLRIKGTIRIPRSAMDKIVTDSLSRTGNSE